MMSSQLLFVSLVGTRVRVVVASLASGVVSGRLAVVVVMLGLPRFSSTVLLL